MSLTYLATLTATSCTWRDACVDEANNHVVFVESTSTTLRRYNLSTQAQVGTSYTCVTNPAAVCLISSASAVVASSSSASFDFIELSSGYRTNITSMNTVFASTVKQQYIASDPNLKVAFYCPSSSKELVRVDGNTFGGARLQNYRLNSNESFSSIIYKSPGRFLVGSNFGQVYEIDSNGVIVDQLSTLIEPTDGLGIVTGNRVTNIYYMAFSDNILAVSYSGSNSIQYYDWTTKTQIKRLSPGGANVGNFLTNSASGVCLTGRNYISSDATGSPQSLAELDLTINPGNINDSPALTPNASICVGGGINTSNGLCFMMQQNSTTPANMYIYQLTPRSSTTIANITIQSPNGTDVPGRLIAIQDNGSNDSKIILDTYMQGPATYRFPTGKNLKVIAEYKEGTSSRWECAEITT